VKVPHTLLREEVRIEDYLGSGSRGDAYAEARVVRASFQPTSRLVTDIRGATVDVDALVIIRPEKGPVKAESRVTVRGELYRVARAYAMPDERRPSHWELQVSRIGA